MKLSIIVPVYNTRDYLAACLDSVLLPGAEDYEIIVVNDGSTDDSGEICAEYERRYPDLIRVITTENSGLGAARNVGLEAARGDYLLFLDSDDSLEKGALSEILAAIDGGFDIGIFDLRQVNPSGETVEVIDGMFKGVEGRVARVSGQQRVVLSLSNVGLISTAYIPTAFLRVK